MNSVQDLMDERQKFQDLMNEISSLMKAKLNHHVPAAPNELNETAGINKKSVTRTELLNVLQNIYEACCEEVSISISPVCERVTCQNEYCVQNAESRVHGTESLGNDDIFDSDFSEHPLTSQNKVSPNAMLCQMLGTECPAGNGNPIAIIAYDPGIENNNRCRRIQRLKSRRIRNQRGTKKAQLTTSNS